MGKIDTSRWKEFRVGELFEKLNLRFLPNRVFDKASDISEVKSEEFNLPLVNAKHSNNGIMYYGRKHEWEYEVLTIDIVADGAASTGDVYAQPQETGVLYNAYLVKPKAKCVTGLILFFLSTVIQRCVKDHFGYDNKCTWDKVKHETILLPVDKTGQPDWAYMESYMADLEAKVAESLTLLQTAKDAEKKKVDTREWGEFHLYDIFSISMGNKFDRSKMCEVDEGINFVGRSALTNGVACTVTSVEDKKGNTIQPYPAGDITIALGGSIGAAFVQDKEFYTSQNVCVLHTDNHSITERAKWFAAASITASCGNYEAFTDELNRHIRTDFIIRLPMDKTGQPDWTYMEEYMKMVQKKVKLSLGQFDNNDSKS